VAFSAAGCGKSKSLVPKGVTQPDRYLYERGTEALKGKNWTNARTYFQQIVDNYPQSTFRPDAKLGVGDSYLGENTAESVVLAANEYKEFLSYYPTNARADYAQYKLAMSHFSRMRSAQRDQTETKGAVKEFEGFFDRYPNSPLAPEVKEKLREARDRMTEADYMVGVFYFKVRWYPGAISRFKQILTDDPGFSKRDGTYYYLAESLTRTDKKAEALPYFERLTAEFKVSEFLEPTRKRIQELKAQ
jgi:outer membrane protein assembly factor BamD